VYVFATARGDTIEGQVYFRGGTPAQDAAVTVAGPGGEVLGTTTTDRQGEFTFAARYRCDHKLIADVGEGHRAEFTLSADELPGGLPAPSDPGGRPGEEAPPAPGGAPGARDAAEPSPKSLEAAIDDLNRQIAGLRKDLNGYKNQLRLQDILGGLGYIVGITGVVFYFLGVRRKEAQAAAKG
jgi:nickel transport protein